VALRRICELQSPTKLLIMKRPSNSCSKNTEDTTKKNDFGFQESAILALQGVVEANLTSIFECKLILAALHGKRVTVMSKDLQCGKSILLATVWYKAPLKTFSDTRTL
ncbi:hypothetical protein LZ32DRAFT_522683, partial [Colletotrichum eremochloae]